MSKVSTKLRQQHITHKGQNTKLETILRNVPDFNSAGANYEYILTQSTEMQENWCM